ncbi:MAG: prepilin-type N-terminal cleavage/methylation domain-containing protein [Gammaproteobacteria bacterium]|nr:prepilin-type N-terminal cleavage/methylation domain-containing protein [Gammaproteobacteria bacterium]
MKLLRGFTLIEIAIVLVIIGLILGGVLKGQELINSARVRSMTDQVNGITAAWFAFQDRYRALPGDYSQASTQINAALTNGDGNGQIDQSSERGQVWAQLQAANMLIGSYDGTATGSDYNCAAGTCPQNILGRSMLITFDNQGSGGAADGNELWSGNSISALVLAEMDRKMDDGVATTGDMRVGSGDTGWTATDAGKCLSGTAYNVTTDSGNCAAVFRRF